jgi:autotransporter translocation and assembly factor TamB
MGNFKGKVTGQGENYQIEGTADSEALFADGIYLKAVNVDATVAGTNANYEANGKAVAELLTFEDFRIEFPRLAGNVRRNRNGFSMGRRAAGGRSQVRLDDHRRTIPSRCGR